MPLEYNHPRFRLKYYDLDRFDGPKVGEKAVDFKVKTLEGKEVKLSDYFGKPVVLEMGSFTCPVYTGKIKTMCQIVDEWKKEANFLTLYVREAHPGERIGAHKNMEEKMALAKRAKEERGETKRTILVDEVSGAAHKKYGAWPNSVYIFDKTGKVVYRSKWNNTDEVEQVLTALKEGTPVPKARNRRIEPLTQMRFPTFMQGGFLSLVDFMIASPPLLYRRLFKKVKD